MQYEEFLEVLEKKLCPKLKEGEQIRRVQVLKNNGLKLDGFSYCVEGHKEQPTIYVNHYYREDIADEEFGKAADQILRILRGCQLFSENDVTHILDYSQVKDRIYYRLVSREKNRELLEQVPYLPWLDLAIVFYIRIPENMIKNATALIYTKHMDRWGITLGDLYRTASNNMAKLSIELTPMEQFLEGFGMEASHTGMYVLRSSEQDFGAAVIVDKKVLVGCCQRLGEDFYVLPSSIHEVILLPVSIASSKEELEEMVREVNENCVGQEDYLSGRVYQYSSVLGRLI